MQHCILVKFKKEISKEDITNMIPEIQAVFDPLLEMEGIYEVKLISNVIDRENRYDLLIRIRMEQEALERYDASVPHKMWKEKYGEMLEKKAIFDHEDISDQ